MSYSYPVNALLLVGPTGVGKSPLGDALAQKGLFGRRCHHLDFGSELRGAVSGGDRSASYTADELTFIHGVLEQGLLLEDEHFPLARKIVSLFLGRVGFSSGDLLILNGMPRHHGQARDVATIARVHGLIVLDCSADDVFYRIHHNVGGDRTERIDDNRDLIEKKLVIFRQRTAPLIEHYEQTGSRIYRLTIAGTTSTEQAYQKILKLAALHPPLAFVAEPPER